MLKKIKDTVKRVNSNKGTSFCAGHTQREKQFRRWQSKEAISRVSRKKKRKVLNCSAERRQNVQ